MKIEKDGGREEKIQIEIEGSILILRARIKIKFSEFLTILFE